MDKKNLNGMAIGENLINWMIENIPSGSVILELGSGSGTKELVKHYTVYSIEDDIKWVGHCNDSKYIYAPRVNGWYDVNKIKEGIPSNYDVILIDGPYIPNANRRGFLENIDLFDTDTIMIFDDTHAEKHKLLMEDVVKLTNKTIIESKYNNEKGFTVIK